MISQVVCQVPLRVEIWASAVVSSILGTVTDDQESNSDFISKLSVYI